MQTKGIKEFKKPEGKTKYNLAGETMNLEPENVQKFSEKDFFDTESRQAFHRFAWLANSGLINEPANIRAFSSLYTQFPYNVINTYGFYKYKFNDYYRNVFTQMKNDESF